MGRHPAERRVTEGPPQAVHRVGDRRVQQEGDAEPAPRRSAPGPTGGQCAGQPGPGRQVGRAGATPRSRLRS